VPKFKSDELLIFTERLLLAGGFPDGDAQLVAKLLVKADLRGYPGHGVTRVPPYVEWLKDGTINILERPKIERQGKITAVIDGNHYIGQVAAHKAMDLAIEKARQHGAGIVCLHRAGHSGRLADYMEMAADAGMIGVGALSVGSGTTTFYGGMERLTGTNPMAFGIPARNGGHIIHDFATAAMSMGEIQKRVMKKEAIPDNVMLDDQGNSTNDFKTFRGPPRGVFLPFGGYKGSGVALVAEVLGGILSGNGAGREWWDKGGHGVNGLFLQAFAVDEFQALDAFYDKLEEFISFIKSSRCAPGFNEILLPGEMARRREAKQVKEGVEIDDSTWASLTILAAQIGIPAAPQPL
jgi:LDH2 family malate/lactate/ureidoglycolate dehydrogenase